MSMPQMPSNNAWDGRYGHNRPTICTASGIEFRPMDPRPEDVRIEDIAHALANINRFSGHTREPYSVAQHSCLVADVVKDGGAPLSVVAMALMHDAAEAYIGDMAGPLKREKALRGYRDMESRVADAIDIAFGLANQSSRELAQAFRVISNADGAMLRAERRDLMPDAQWWPVCDQVGWIPTIVPWPWRRARDEFLARAAALMPL